MAAMSPMKPILIPQTPFLSLPHSFPSPGVPGRTAHQHVTTVDLDVDIGADAVDYNAIANQESLSGLETEMRKLESVVSEIMNEMEYLKKRESKMRDTNGEWSLIMCYVRCATWKERLLDPRIHASSTPASNRIALLLHLRFLR